MNDNKKLSLKIILVGELIVNIPALAVFIIFVVMTQFYGFGWNKSIIVSAAISYLVWEKLLLIWKRWALKQGITKEKLFRLGKFGLINFFRYKIID